MPNKIAKNKKSYTFLLEKSVMGQIDNEAYRLNVSRTEIVKKALNEYLSRDPIHASKNDIESLKNDINELKMQNVAISEAFKRIADNQDQQKLITDGNKKSSWFKKIFKNT